MNKQPLIMKIPDPWRKSESEQMHQRENMLSETCGVGVMLCDFQNVAPLRGEHGSAAASTVFKTLSYLNTRVG